MKFEKFFKSAGTHGQVVKNGVDTWLVCGGVGMKIPEGINNLGISVKPDEMFTAIVNAEPDSDILILKSAILKDPEGKAGDIIRVFETDFGDKVGINNDKYGLLEKRDVLTYLEIEDDDPEHDGEIVRYILVSDHNKEVVGFIHGTADI